MIARNIIRRSIVTFALGALLGALPARAQRPVIQYLHPDVGAPGMCVQVDVVARKDTAYAYGPDAAFPSSLQVVFVNPDDTARIRVGPIVVRYYGRLLHTVFMINPNAAPGPVPFRIRHGAQIGNVDTFTIVAPEHIGTLNGGYATIGDKTPGHGRRSKRGVIVADSLVLAGGTYGFTTADADATQAGNQGMFPVTVLLTGRFAIDNLSTLKLDGVGSDGGPGGGGAQGNYVVLGCPNPPAFIAPGSGYAGGGAQGSGSDGTGTGAGGKSMSNCAPFASGGPSLPFEDGVTGGGGGIGTIDTNFIAGGGGGGGNALAGGNANSGATSNGGRAIGSPDIVPLTGGGGGGGGAAYGSQCPASGRGGGGAGAMAVFANAGIELHGDVTAEGADGGQAQCNSATSNSGGGGGGAGGSVVFSSPSYVTALGRFSAAGGNSGGPCGTGFGGGQGGEGKVRIDGPLSGTGTFTPVVRFHGPTVSARSLTTANADSVWGTGNAGDSVAMWLMNAEAGLKRAVGPFFAVVSPSNAYSIYVKPDSLKAAASDSLISIVVAQRATDLYTNTATWVMGHSSGRIVNLAHGLLADMDSIYDCGKTAVGQTGSTSIRVTNIGNHAMTITSVLPVWTGTANIFSLSKPALPLRIPAGGSVTLTVHFAPRDTGDVSDSLVFISSERGTAPQFMRVRGRGLPGSKALRVDTLVQFGAVAMGATRMIHIPVHSIGSDSIHIPFLGTFGPDVTEFSLKTMSPIVIAPRDSFILEVLFTASTVGDKRAGLSMSTDDSAGRHEINLAGRVVRDSVTVPLLVKVKPASVGDTSIEICNARESVLTIIDATLASKAAGFGVTSFPHSLAAGACGNIVLHYDNAQETILHLELQEAPSMDIVVRRDSGSAVAENTLMPGAGLMAYPNPLNDITVISSTRSGAVVTAHDVSVIDPLGRTLVAPGARELTTNADGVQVRLDGFPAGVYYARVMQRGNVSLIPLMVLR